ncbi:hypothetical protein Ahy_B07g088066 isoform A [Arachis hypogaea]|uniref:Uncharacterized protein n=1 Tax=Arachis hypogaea TaxID=3818 RepID=A0A444YDL6_ARAHY|nr:hypothetical protein Ahy_B07g088066 isoform A [Arachis hypogaea]
MPPQVSTGPPFAPLAAPSFRPLSPQAPHFSPLPNPSGGAAPPSLAYQNPSIPPPDVSSAAAIAPSVASAAGGVAVPYRTRFGAILSAGTFVSALVVGFVAIYAAPFSLDPAPFVRDVLFYLAAAMFLFYVYLSAEIFLWQAIGFVKFYAFLVGLVFYMDLGVVDGRGKSGNSSPDLEEQKELVAVHVDSDAKVSGSMNDKKRSSGFPRAYGLNLNERNSSRNKEPDL